MKNLKEYIIEGKQKYYIWTEMGKWKGSHENFYNKRFEDANAIQDWSNFDNEDEIEEYIHKYFNKDLDVTVVKK